MNTQRHHGWWHLALMAAVLMLAEGCAAKRPPATLPHAPGGIAFLATAYCQGATTATGVAARRGIVAADPTVLPMGAVVRVERTGRYDGEYRVMDTGPKVQGHHVDLFISDCAAAKRFGRRNVRVTIINAHD